MKKRNAVILGAALGISASFCTYAADFGHEQTLTISGKPAYLAETSAREKNTRLQTDGNGSYLFYGRRNQTAETGSNPMAGKCLCPQGHQIVSRHSGYRRQNGFGQCEADQHRRSG